MNDIYPFPYEERAFECYSLAADAGLPEATYKLGDMYKHGTGCEANAQEAFRCYEGRSTWASAKNGVKRCKQELSV